MDQAIVALPSPDVAPAIRDGIRDLAHWRFREVSDGYGAIEPEEGAGAVYPYFRIRKLCDSSTVLDDDTWEPLRGNPALTLDDLATPRSRPDGPPDPNWRTVLREKADKMKD